MPQRKSEKLSRNFKRKINCPSPASNSIEHRITRFDKTSKIHVKTLALKLHSKPKESERVEAERNISQHRAILNIFDTFSY